MKQIAKGIFILVSLCLLATALPAKTYKISGKILDLEGKGVGGAEVVLLDADGEEIGKERTKKRVGKGGFGFKKIDSGTYTLKASGDGEEATQEVTVEDDDVEVELLLLHHHWP